MNSKLLRIKTLMMVLMAVVGLTLNAHSQIQIGQDIDGEATYDESGYSVSMPDANTLAIGARGNDGSATGAGHVRVYTLDGTDWVQKGVDIDGVAIGDQSGGSVSMPDANTVAIGASNYAGTGLNSGQVRIYAWNGTAWVQKGWDLIGEAGSDYSGGSVCMPDANTVAIGATGNDSNGSSAGHVRIYAWIGNGWVQKGIDIDGEATGDLSGHSVSMPDANTVAIGAVSNDGSAVEAGHVRVYVWNGTNWAQKGLDIDGEVASDNSGWSVSMPDANTVAIGAISNDGNGAYAGHVRIYAWDGTTWLQKGIDFDGEAANDGSGWSVSMPDANTCAIGAEGNDGSSSNAGHVRIYTWDGTSWIQKGIDIDGEAYDDRSGRTVSMPDANTVAIGAFWNNGNSSNEGHVRVYKLNGVQGLVYNDINQNCINDELGVVAGILGIIQPGNIIVETASNGDWDVDSLPIGNYTITYDTTGNWLATCLNPMSFTVTDPNSTTQAPNFGMINTNPCPEPNVSIYMPFMRPGFSNQKIYVSVCNAVTGTGALNNASVVVTLDDLITVNAASIGYTSLGNNVFNFDIGNINPGECVNFNISTTVSNSAILSQTLCIEALLLPVDSCVLDTLSAPAPPDFSPCSLPWDNSSILVEGECVNDSIVFTITNTGDLGNGDMDCFSPVRLYIDGVYIWLDSIQLLGGESFTYSFAGDGQTWHLEVDQHPLHPGNSNPNATIELCGNPANWTPNLVNIFPQDDLDPVNDIHCGIVTGSYDPNDKTGFPLGVGTENLIEANGKIDYVIRFQNTGTDTAFTVIIRDTLDLDLDIFSVNSGVASHPYTFKMYGPRVLEWTFSNILLPDSTTDEPGSNGFTTFTVFQVPNLPDGTEINNTGNIYFDFNPPIITNTTSHIIGSEIGTASWTEQYDIASTSCDEYQYNGLTYIQTGSYFQVMEGVSTDTLVTLNVTINNSNAVTDVHIQPTCGYLTWIDGITYTSSTNIPTWTLTNSQGCDSVVTLDLSINNSTGVDVQSACESYTWIDGVTYTSSTNIPTWTLTNALGCDSVVTFDLSINNSSGIDLQSACESYTWIDGVTYTSSTNIPTWTLTNALGCDSVVTLDLSIINSTVGTDIQIDCDSFTWIDGITYTSSTNIPTWTLTNSVGCDSVVTLNLSINNSTGIDVQSVCESYTWIDGIIYSSSTNIPTWTLTNALGCDSVVTLDLTINNSTAGTDIQTACDSYLWIDGNTYITSNNTATQTFTNAAGCDSVVTLDLTINTISDVTTTLSGITITSNNAAASYVWLDCDDNFAAISGETTQSYTPTANGNYAVELSENGCVDTSACVAVTTIGIIENSMTENFVLFPNPTSGEVKIVFENAQQEVNVSLFSVTGQLLEQKTFENSAEIMIEIEGSPGVYLLKLNSNDQEATIRVVKE